MAKRFLIGVGGTGSKCIEAITHMSACGLGPEEMHVGLVEMDRQNGNLSRTVKTMAEYNTLHQTLVGADAGMGKSRLLGSRLNLPPGELFWCPLTDPSQTFELYCGRHRLPTVPRLFFDSLYTREESQEPLDAGFRGRPSMGAPVFLNLDVEQSYNTDEETLWTLLFDKGRLTDIDVHIFLTGSIFGGTGASGIPNLAKIIRKKFAEKNTSGKLTIGAALMLPYFTFSTQKFNDEDVVARPETFQANAKATLHYYSNLQAQKLFDSIFLIGWSPLIELKNVSAGSGSQKNPSLLPELIAAQSCLRFFEAPDSVNGVVLTKRENENIFKWSDLPSIKIDNNNEALLSMGSMARFAYAYLNIYAPFLDAQNNTAADLQRRLYRVASEPWFHRLFTRNNVDIMEKQATFDTMTKFCTRYLAWINSICRSVKETQLFDVRGFENTDPEACTQSGIGLAELKNGKDFTYDGFTSLIADRPGSDLRSVFKQLNLYTPPSQEKIQGLGVFFRALHDVCSI